MIELEVLARVRGLLSTTGEGGTAQLPISEVAAIDFANGTGANEANAVYVDEFSIAASGTLDTDLSGALKDRLGNNVVFTAIKAIMVIADATNTNNVVVGADAAPFVGPFGAGTHTVAVPPGGVFLVANPSAAGWPVTATTADILQLANSAAGTAVTGTLVLVGETA